MSGFALKSAAYEYGRVPDDVASVSGGSWSSSGNNGRSWGLTVNAPDAAALRGIAAVLMEAAEVAESKVQRP